MTRAPRPRHPRRALHGEGPTGDSRRLTPAKGIALVLGAGMLWGTTGTAQSFSPDALSPYWVGALRLLLASAFFVLYSTAANTHGLRQQAGGLEWRHAALAGACMAAYNLAFFAGVKATGVAVGTALALGSGPIWAGLLQMMLGKLPSAGWWLGTLISVTGGVLLVFGRNSGLQADPIGIGLCLTSGFAYALYAVINKRLVHRSDPGIVTLAVFAMGALIALPAAWMVAGPLHMTTSGWLVVIFLGVASTGIAYLMFSWGLRAISAASGVSLALAEPVTAFLLAIVIVGERPGWLAYPGLLALLAGLAIVIRTEARQNIRPGFSQKGNQHIF